VAVAVMAEEVLGVGETEEVAAALVVVGAVTVEQEETAAVV